MLPPFAVVAPIALAFLVGAVIVPERAGLRYPAVGGAATAHLVAWEIGRRAARSAVFDQAGTDRPIWVIDQAEKHVGKLATFARLGIVAVVVANAAVLLGSPGGLVGVGILAANLAFQAGMFAAEGMTLRAQGRLVRAVAA